MVEIWLLVVSKKKLLDWLAVKQKVGGRVVMAMGAVDHVVS